MHAAGVPGPAPDEAGARRILAMLAADDIDAAIEAGLPRVQPLEALAAAENAALLEARDRLLAAWAARDRHRAREARLQRIARTRAEARVGRERPAAPGASASARPDASGPPRAEPPARPALPAAAAAALARARARANRGGA